MHDEDDKGPHAKSGATTLRLFDGVEDEGVEGVEDGEASVISFAARSGTIKRDMEQRRRNGGGKPRAGSNRTEDAPPVLASPFVTEDERAAKDCSHELVEKVRSTAQWPGLIAEAQSVDRLRPAAVIERAATMLQNVVSDPLDYPSERLAKGLSLMIRRQLAQKRYRTVTASDNDDGPRVG